MYGHRAEGKGAGKIMCVLGQILGKQLSYPKIFDLPNEIF